MPGRCTVHTHWVGPNRLSIPDARGQGASLRVTRHPEQRKIVLSHWRDGLCVASTPIELSEVSALIGVLADALGDAIDAPTISGAPGPGPRGPGGLTALRRWLRPRLAQVTELRLVREDHSRRAHGPDDQTERRAKTTDPAVRSTTSQRESRARYSASGVRGAHTT